MIRRPPRSTRTDTLFPYTTLVRSAATSPGFVSVKLSPGWGFNQVDDTDPIATYRYLATELGRRSIAYLHVGNYGIEWDVFGTIRPLFDGTMIYNVGFNRASATRAVETNGADMVAIGQESSEDRQEGKEFVK